jgi:hypothetical protein
MRLKVKHRNITERLGRELISQKDYMLIMASQDAVVVSGANLPFLFVEDDRKKRCTCIRGAFILVPPHTPFFET